ncbi:MAG: hypothetical protein AAF235_00490, partial [Planctomycetota bacterium]
MLSSTPKRSICRPAARVAVCSLLAASGGAQAQMCEGDAVFEGSGAASWFDPVWSPRPIGPFGSIVTDPPTPGERAVFDMPGIVLHNSGTGEPTAICGLLAHGQADVTLSIFESLLLTGEGLEVRAPNLDVLLAIENVLPDSMLETPSILLTAASDTSARLELLPSSAPSTGIVLRSVNGVPQGSVSIGPAGRASALIDGASVQMFPGYAVDTVIGGEAGSDGLLSIVNGASVELFGSSLTVGQFGTGQIDVAGSQLVTQSITGAILGFQSGSVGRVTVTQGGVWVANGRMIEVGAFGRGRLVVTETSDVDSPGGVLVPSGGEVSLTGTITGDVTAAGGEIRLFGSGDFESELTSRIAGALMLSGQSPRRGVFAPGRLSVRVDSVGAPGTAGVASSLRVDMVEFDGTLRIIAPASLQPAVGDEIHIVDA